MGLSPWAIISRTFPRTLAVIGLLYPVGCFHAHVLLGVRLHTPPHPFHDCGGQEVQTGSDICHQPPINTCTFTRRCSQHTTYPTVTRATLAWSIYMLISDIYHLLLAPFNLSLMGDTFFKKQQQFWCSTLLGQLSRVRVLENEFIN